MEKSLALASLILFDKIVRMKLQKYTITLTQLLSNVLNEFLAIMLRIGFDFRYKTMVIKHLVSTSMCFTMISRIYE